MFSSTNTLKMQLIMMLIFLPVKDMNTKVEEITVKMDALMQRRSEVETNDEGIPLHVRQEVW